MQNQRVINVALLSIALLAAVAAGLAYKNARAVLDGAPSVLSTIDERLNEHLRLQKQLLDPKFQEPGASDPLAAYLARIRRDGLPKHAEMKQLIDGLADTSVGLVALLDAYQAGAQTDEFKSEARVFRSYSDRLNERRNSIFGVFMGGGNLPAGGLAPPPGLAAAVAAEKVAE
jgi:hypothetical protein